MQDSELIGPVCMQPENVLLQKNGHIKLTDFDLSYMGGTVNPKVTFNPSVFKRKQKVSCLLSSSRSTAGL